MPRVNMYRDKTADRIKGLTFSKGMKMQDVFTVMRMPKQRFYRRMRDTDTLTLGELRQMARLGGWSDEEVITVFKADRE